MTVLAADIKLHDLTLRDTVIFYGNRLTWKTEMPIFTSYLLKLKKI